MIASALILSLSLATFLATDAWASLRRLDSAIAERDSVRAELAKFKLESANASTTTAIAAEKAQERRADALEKDVSDAASNPSGGGTGLERLHDLATATGAPAPGTDLGRTGG